MRLKVARSKRADARNSTAEVTANRKVMERFGFASSVGRPEDLDHRHIEAAAGESGNDLRFDKLGHLPEQELQPNERPNEPLQTIRLV